MSAPDTNLNRQANRHKPSLWGIALAVVAAGVFAVVALSWGGFPADEQASGAPAVSAVAD